MLQLPWRSQEMVIDKSHRRSPILLPILQFCIAKIGSFGLFKILLFVLALSLSYSVYQDPQKWLEKLDSTPIKAYSLSGQIRFTQNADIRRVLTEPELKGFFAQDIKEVEQKLLGISWIKAVAVRKIYPDRLSITLLEHTPTALWNTNQLLSEQGVVFSLPPDRFDAEHLPRLYGPDNQSKLALSAWYKIGQDLAQRKLTLKSLEVDERGAWKIILDNNIKLHLGRGDWLPKIDRFVEIYPQIEIPQGKHLAYVDLRYEHGVAVGFSDN